MHKLIDNYNKAQQALLDHVGLVPDWVMCPIVDYTEMWWRVGKYSVYYSTTKDGVGDEDGMESYSDAIYTQRHYNKHVYEGEDLTLVFCDPHTDHCQWWRIFDNTKRVK